jgi:hypothetical protein
MYSSPGIDFGIDSVRAVIANGAELGSACWPIQARDAFAGVNPSSGLSRRMKERIAIRQRQDNPLSVSSLKPPHFPTL